MKFITLAHLGDERGWLLWDASPVPSWPRWWNDVAFTNISDPDSDSLEPGMLIDIHPLDTRKITRLEDIMGVLRDDRESFVRVQNNE